MNEWRAWAEVSGNVVFANDLSPNTGQAPVSSIVRTYTYLFLLQFCMEVQYRQRYLGKYKRHPDVRVAGTRYLVGYQQSGWQF